MSDYNFRQYEINPGEGERRRFQHLELDGHWGVWDWEHKGWRRAANYTRQDAARMSGFLNRQKGLG